MQQQSSGSSGCGAAAAAEESSIAHGDTIPSRSRLSLSLSALFYFFCLCVLRCICLATDAFEVESFISSEEFVEKTFEEFYRCTTGGGGTDAPSGHVKLNATQLLLACLHLEQDLRPLIPPQAAKHRQPQLSDVEIIMKQFGGPSGSSGSGGSGGGSNSARAGNLELDDQQFLQFSRVLFRNVCAHVKL